LRHSPVGLAYVAPAAMALKFGNDDGITAKLAATARTAGVRRLVRTGWGRRFLLWYSLPPVARKKARAAEHRAREIVKAANLRLRGAR
jgi:hypothetical protein